MIVSTYACALLILAASLVLGRALLAALGERPIWLAGAVGFALLVVLAPLLIRLPGRATTAAILLGLLLIGAIAILWRNGWVRRGRVGASPTEPPQHGREDYAMHGRESGSGGDAPARPHLVAVAVVLITIAAASFPFIANDRLGILGEGIYTNDHAAQLYWADWLQNGFGPEPSAVQFGYPTGPQSVAVIAAEATGADLVDAFNGLLLAIPALTALAALAALGGLPPGRRLIAASLTALPYLAASYIAQSAFKETAMAMLLLTFAITLGLLRGRTIVVVLAVLAAASVFTFSLPGLVWFAVALPAWLVLEAMAGRRPIELGPARELIARHRAATAIVVVIVLALIALVVGPAASFVEKINDVEASAGRLSSPVFPGEALGVWPEGDFRLVRGDVSGAVPATLLGLVAVGLGLLVLVRRSDNALLASAGAAAVVYVGARLVAQIHVEAKALAVMAPLLMLVALRALFASQGEGETRRVAIARNALGAGFALAAVASTFLALRAAPVGFDQRAEGLERLGERIQGEKVAFLGVDRFGAYWLRGTLIRSPGGYVPPEVAARPEKVWQQGKAMDLDTLASYKLDQFDYAITTNAAYQSTPPPSMEFVAADGDYALWKRTGATPRDRVLDAEGTGPGNPGAPLDCAGSAPDRHLTGRPGEAKALAQPVLLSPEGWRGPERVTDAAAGQENAFLAPATASTDVDLPRPGAYRLSLQYHSQAPLEILVDGEQVAGLPPSLDGMYLTSAGRGAFWPAGELDSSRSGTRTISVRAEDPTGLQDALGVERRVWLGALGVMPVVQPQEIPMADACERYLDRFTLSRRGKGGPP